MRSEKGQSDTKVGRSLPRTTTSKSSTSSAAGLSTSSPSSRGGRTLSTCPACNKGRLRRAKVKQEMFGFNLGTYTAEICDSCGERFIDLEDFKKTEARAKALGLWGL